MKALISVLVVWSIAASAGLWVGWQNVRQLQDENASLRKELESAKLAADTAAETAEASHAAELKQLRADAKEVHKLRGQVNQLRSGRDALAQAQAANQRLSAENEQLRNTSLAELDALGEGPAGSERFLKENWSFLGYASPEDALVTAIFSMQEGDPQAYFDSLAPAEQERMAERWQDKTAEEVAEKHRSDVESISGLQMLSSQVVSDNEVLMDVYIQGPDRLQRVSMQRVDDQWKFGGYVQDEAPAPSQ